MHPVAALTLLYGPLARYTSPTAPLLPDGSPPPRGGTRCEDPRDPDKVAKAGRLSSALYRMVQQHEHGALIARALQEYFTRAGIPHQGHRLELATEALIKAGVYAGPKRASFTRKVERVERLIQEGIRVYGQQLRAA